MQRDGHQFPPTPEEQAAQQAAAQRAQVAVFRSLSRARQRPEG